MAEALVGQHCEACEPGTPPVTEEVASDLAQQTPAWDRDSNQSLKREFQFDNFIDAVGFVDRVCMVAESEGHHPDIELGWGRAAFSLMTHHASGLTRNDFILAAKIDRLAETGAPKG